MKGLFKKLRIFWIKHIIGRRVVSACYKTTSNTMTINWSDGSKIKYIGDCTVWHELPDYRRCTTTEEEILHRIWAKWTKK